MRVRVSQGVQLNTFFDITKKLRQMETIQTFVLGAASALALIGLGYSFVSVLRINKTVNQLNEKSKEVENEFGETHRSIDERTHHLEKHLHDRMDDMCEDFKHINDEIRRIIDELSSYTDSRFDKTIDKLCERMDMQDNELIKVVEQHDSRLAELETDKKVSEDKIEQINS
jgi:CHASE3 domain sensor protein